MNRCTQIGRRMYSLRYTVNSVCCLEERFKKGLHQLLLTDVSSVRALLWCALLHDEKNKMTLEETGKILDEALKEGQSLADIGRLCADALSDAGFFRAAERQKSQGSRFAKST